MITHTSLLFLLTVIANALGQVASDIYLPSLPAISQSLQTQTNFVQFTMTSYTAGMALAQVLYGPVSDGVGRRKLLSIGLVLVVLSSAICTIAPSIEYLILGRFLQGLGAGGGVALIRPIIRDLFTGEKFARMAAYSGLISVFTIATAPLLGGYIQTFFHWRANFILITAIAAMLLCAVLWCFTETHVHLNKQNLKPRVVASNLSVLVTNRVFMGHSLISLFSYAAMIAWLTAGPVVLQDVVGLTPRAYGEVYFICGLMLALGMLIYTRCVKYYFLESLLQFGLLCALLSGMLMLGFYFMGYVNTWVIVGPILVLFFGLTFIFPTVGTLAYEPFPHISGMASALFGSMRLLGGATSSATIASIHENNQAPMAIVIIVSVLFALVAFYGLAKRELT